MNFFDKLTHEAEPFELKLVAPLMSGLGERGRTISLQSLHKRGATLLGYLKNVHDYILTFDTNAADHVRFGDTFSGNVKMGIDQFILHTGIQAAPPEDDPDDVFDTNLSCVSDITHLYCKENNITSSFGQPDSRLILVGLNCRWSIKTEIPSIQTGYLRRRDYILSDYPGCEN
jgi:putative flavoprotein involved in K+ transport